MKPDSYREAFAARQPDRLLSLCADDVTLHSPLASEPGFEGRDVVAIMLPVVLEVFEETQYTHEFGDRRSHMLVADSRVLDERIKIATLLELNPDGKISDIWLMARPLKVITTLLEAVGRVLDGSGRGDVSVVYDLAKPLAALAAASDRVNARLVDGLNHSTL